MLELAEKISDAEFAVLEVLWQADEPLPVPPIRIQLERERGWNASTVKTLLGRLCSKGVIAAEKREAFYYRPMVSREEYQKWSTQSLLKRVYRGSARDLVASLVDTNQLTVQDLEELRGILYPQEGKNG